MRILVMIVMLLTMCNNTSALMLETRDRAYHRHQAEMYQQRENNPYGYDEPLGGYREKLGDSYGDYNW